MQVGTLPACHGGIAVMTLSIGESLLRVDLALGGPLLPGHNPPICEGRCLPDDVSMPEYQYSTCSAEVVASGTI